MHDETNSKRDPCVIVSIIDSIITKAARSKLFKDS